MNKLSLNTVKTEFMIIRKSQRLNQLDQSPESTPYIIMIDGGEIRRVKSVKYLGMIVGDKLTSEQHIEYASEKIVRNIGILKRIRNFIPHESLLLLYHTLIEPYLRYCSIIWGQCNESLKDRLQALQNKAARTIARRAAFLLGTRYSLQTYSLFSKVYSLFSEVYSLFSTIYSLFSTVYSLLITR